MAHDLDLHSFELPTIEDAFAGDSRTLAFQVVDADGTAVDISNATVSWALYERAYHDSASEVVIGGADSDVELVTDNRVDTTNGEWEVRLDPSATDPEWGRYWHRPEVEQQDGSVATWRGELRLEA